ncbi:MAG: hypothetical protein WKF82_02605 [Nocardioidaceae bacterium]
MTAHLKAVALTKRYRDRCVVREVDWSVPRGTVVWACRSQRRGQTTLLRMVVGLVARTSGRPAVRAVASAWVALSFLFAYVFPYLTYRTGAATVADDGVSRYVIGLALSPAHAPQVAIQAMPLFGGAMMTVLGVLVTGSGYSWGTWKTTAHPRRLPTGLHRRVSRCCNLRDRCARPARDGAVAGRLVTHRPGRRPEPPYQGSG